MTEQILLITDPLSSSLEAFLRHAPAGVPSDNFFQDLTAEWEDNKTVKAIAEKWTSAGFQVEIHEMSLSLPQRMAEKVSVASSPFLVHSLVEGWGTPSREAWIPSLCESLGIPWIGSSVSGMTLCMDKDLVIQLAAGLGIPVPRGRFVYSTDEYFQTVESFAGAAHFIKPNCEGSGMGVNDRSLRPRGSPLTAKECHERLNMHPDGLRVEEALPGKEYTSALVGDSLFLPIAEIEVPGSIYGLEHKRKDIMTEKVTFPALPFEIENAIQTDSMKLWKRLGLKDMARIDWKCDAQGKPHLLEINPLPGLSPYYSVLPRQWAQTGRTYEELLKQLALSCLKKKESRALRYGQSFMRRSMSQSK